MPRVGRMSNADRDFIKANAYTLSVEQIAEKLDRNVEAIAEHIKLHVPPPTGPARSDGDDHVKVVVRQELRNSEAWKNLKLEFIPEELKYFEEAYVKLMAQFKNEGVLASEEEQVFQAIKYQILMSRNLKERKKAREDINRLERMQEDFLAQFGGDPSQMTDGQKDFSLNLETQLNAARQAEQSRTNEYVKLQERHESLMKALKAVRDQRIKQIEARSVNFLEVIKDLMNRDVQEREGRQMELMRLAGEAEYERLGRPHKYEDGNEDSPILSAETVDLGPEEDVESSDDDKTSIRDAEANED